MTDDLISDAMKQMRINLALYLETYEFYNF